MIWATVITDASWCPHTRGGGWAAWIRIDGGSGAVQCGAPFEDQPTTSTDAEVRAAIAGIDKAVELGARGVLIQSDCMAVIHLTERRTWNRGDLWDRSVADWFGRGLSKMRGKHVKGHSRDPAARSWVNRWCDREARKHMLTARSKFSSGDVPDDWDPIDREDT